MKNRCETCKSLANFVAAIIKTPKGYQNALQAMMNRLGKGISQDRRWDDRKWISKKSKLGQKFQGNLITIYLDLKHKMISIRSLGTRKASVWSKIWWKSGINKVLEAKSFKIKSKEIVVLLLYISFDDEKHLLAESLNIKYCGFQHISS